MKIDIRHVAKLANLTLSEEEKKKFTKQLDETIQYINRLGQIDTKNVKPTSQVVGLENITRKDVAQPSLSQEKVLSNSKSTHNGMFKVKAVLDS